MRADRRERRHPGAVSKDPRAPESHALLPGPGVEWRDRAHFFAFASRLMRSILIDYARARNSIKRGSGTPALSLIDTDAALPPPDLDILALNEALEELEKKHAFERG